MVLRAGSPGAEEHNPVGVPIEAEAEARLRQIPERQWQFLLLLNVISTALAIQLPSSGVFQGHDGPHASDGRDDARDLQGADAIGAIDHQVLHCLVEA